MTSKLKCPFCGKELKDQWVGQNVAYEYFDCPKCKMNGNPKLWQALIQSQKDLANMKEQAEFNAIMRGKDDADEIFGLKEQIEICNKREYKLTEQIAILKQDLEIARKALEDIKSDYELYAKQGCRMEPNETDMYNYACNALEQIEHKEQI